MRPVTRVGGVTPTYRTGRRPRCTRFRSRDQTGSALPILGSMKIVSAADAVAGIRSGDQIYLHCAAATPSVLLDALVARASELEHVSVVHLHCEGPGPHLAPEM